VFERFTERARQVVVLAQEEARRLSDDRIGTEHLLLGLIGEEDGSAGRVLADLGVTAQAAREQVRAAGGPGGRRARVGQVPFTPRAKKGLELALRESLALGDSYIGTEHVLLGLLRDGRSTAVIVLRALGVEPDATRTAVLADRGRAILDAHERTLSGLLSALAAEPPLAAAVLAEFGVTEDVLRAAVERHRGAS